MILEFAKSDVQPTLYSYSELRAATRDFNPELKVGEGAFGVVYKVLIKIVFTILVVVGILFYITCYSWW